MSNGKLEDAIARHCETNENMTSEQRARAEAFVKEIRIHLNLLDFDENPNDEELRHFCNCVEISMDTYKNG